MRRQKNRWLHLFIALCSLCGIGAIVIFMPPQQGTPYINLPSWTILLFLIIVFLTYGLGFLLKNVRRGFLIGIVLSLYLFLRMIHVANLFFLLLLIALALTLELTFSRS